MSPPWLPAASIVLVIGCQPQPRQPRPAPVATVEVARSETVVDRPSPDAGRGLLSVDEPGLVGTLVLNHPRSDVRPSEYCLDDGHLYAGAPARIGKLPLFTSSDVAGLAGATVLARGVREPSLLALLTDQGTCPADPGERLEAPQMRSDWLSPEGGSRTTRQRLSQLPCFRARELRIAPIGAGTTSDGRTVTIELVNPFAVSLASLSARAHYEGGPGKPMPLFRDVELALPAGGRQQVALDARVDGGPAGRLEGSPRGAYRLHSLELTGQLGSTDFDVTIAIGR